MRNLISMLKEHLTSILHFVGVMAVHQSATYKEGNMMVTSGVETVQISFILLSQVTIMISLWCFMQHVKVCSLRGNRFSSFVSSTWCFSLLSHINLAGLQWVSLGEILSRCGRRLTVNELWALCYTCLSSLQSYIDFPGDCDTRHVYLPRMSHAADLCLVH